MALFDNVWRSDRVRAFTASHVNDRIDQMTRASIAQLKEAPRDVILRRLTLLDREWDIERALAANFSVLGHVFVELGQRSMLFRWMTRAQLFFLFTHTTVGWCPPLPLFRRLGFRTNKEIQGEREALLAILQSRGEPLDAPLLDSLPPQTPQYGSAPQAAGPTVTGARTGARQATTTP